MAFNSEQKKAYRQRPEVKARARDYMAAWREAKRAGSEAISVQSRDDEQQQFDFVSDAVEKQTDV
jgi:ribosomal protein S20